jgi:hAT family C-terminal dimerisation region
MRRLNGLFVYTLTKALDPANSNKAMATKDKQKIQYLLRKYLGPAAGDQAINIWYQFRQREGAFAGQIEEHFDPWNSDLLLNPIAFLRSFEDANPPLANLAIRIFSTVANSAISERAFSAMNWVQDAHRSKLQPDRQNMATFIYTNNKSLRRIAENRTRIH